MAHFSLAALPYYQQAQDQAQQQAIQRQQAMIQLSNFQQEQQNRQRQQAALAAAGNALPQLIGGQQMQPPPQAPNPGQSSQPQQGMQPQQGGGMSMPSGPPPGQVNRPPIPPGGPQGSMPPAGIPPFRPVPTAGSPTQAAPGAIPPPPSPQPQQGQQGQPGPLTLESAIKVLKDQGLSGADLMAGLGQLMPILDSQSKAQAAQLQQQFTHELQLASLQERYDALRQRAEDSQANRADREAAHADSMGIRAQMLELARQRQGSGASGPPAADLKPDAQGNLPAPPAIAGYSSEAIKALAEDYAARGPSALSGFGNKNLPPAARAAIVNYSAALNAKNGQNYATNKIQYAADTAGARVNATQAAKVDASASALTQPGGIGEQFQQSIDALNRTGIPVANQAQMAALRATFDPRIAAYDQATNGVVSEMAQILGRGQVTVTSMDEARKVVSQWHTSEQARAGLAQARKEAATTVKASSEEVAKSARTPKGQPGAANIPEGWTVTEH